MDTQKKCLRYNDMLSNVSNMLIELQEEGSFCDVTIVCQEAQMNAHKVILASSSYFFRSILKRNPHPHPLVYLGGVQFSLLQSLIQFIYEGSVNMEQSEVESFLALGKELGIKGLAADKDLNAQRKDLNGNEPTGCKTQVPASANIREDQITSEDLKGGTSSDHFSGDDRKEARVKRKSANQKEEGEITTSSKRHCSSNMKEDQHRKCGEHNTKESPFANIEPRIKEFCNQDQSALEENGNAGTDITLTSQSFPYEIHQQKLREKKLGTPDRDVDNDSIYSAYNPSRTSGAESLTGTRGDNVIPIQVQEEPGDWDSSLKKNKSAHEETVRLIDIGPELNKQDTSPARNSDKGDGTKGNGYANFQEDKEKNKASSFHQNVTGARSENSLLLDYEIKQQQLRRELLYGENDQDNDDNMSLYSDYNPPSLGSRSEEIDGTPGTDDEEFEKAISAVLTRVGVDWQCTLCKRQFTMKCNAKRHIKNTHYSKKVFCGNCNCNFKNVSSLAKHVCKRDDDDLIIV